MRLGLMGGTFDPVHNAHLFIAEEARVRMRLDQVLFIPNGQPPHKKQYEVTAPNHRLAMVELAIQDNKSFFVSRLEIDREGRSFAVDTLTTLQASLTQTELFFITGFEDLADSFTWKRHEEVIELCRFVAVAQPGCATGSAIESLPKTYRDRIDILESPHLDISSTEIRERSSHGLPIRYLVPDAVEQYIRDNGLYQ